MASSFLKTDNLVEATAYLIASLGVKVTRSAIADRLNQHIDYPSLNSISDTLSFFKLDNYAIEIPASELPIVPTPCLAALNILGGTFAVINDIKDGFVKWWHNEKGNQQESIDSFLEKWQGILLLAQATEKSGETHYLENRRKELFNLAFQIGFLLNVVGVFTASVYLLFIAYTKFFLFLFLVSTIKFLGIITSILLLWHLLDKNNPFIRRICQVGNKTNCNLVLDSKASKVSDTLSWSEVGFFYFSGSLLAILFSFPSNEVIKALGFINLAALPYTVFSIYYQGFILRKWCILCVLVQILLWVEFSLFYLAYGFPFPLFLSFKGTLLLFITFTSPILFWFSLKPVIQKAFQTDSLKNKLKAFQNDPIIFRHLLLQQPRMFDLHSNMNIIEIGNSNVSNIITIVSDPYCFVCAEKHVLMHDLIKSNSSKLKYQIIFVASNAPDDIRATFVKHLFSLEKSERILALDSWFSMEEKKFDRWIERFPIKKICEKAVETINTYENWNFKSGIKATPTVFVNGYKLPEVYHVEDLKRIAPYIF